MKFKYMLIVGIGIGFAPYFAAADTVAYDALGTANSFGALGGTTITNTNPGGNLPGGPTTIKGNVGVWSSGGPNAITGLSGSQVSGTIYSGGSSPQQAQADLSKAYAALSAMTPTSNLSGQVLGTGVLVLPPGVYRFDSSSQLTGDLKLDAQGKNNAAWVFQVGSTLTSATNASVTVINPGSKNGADDGVFWQVGTSATLGTGSAFAGNIVALNSITLNSMATIAHGRALAEGGAVTMDTNVIGGSDAFANGGGYSGGLHYVGNDLVLAPDAIIVPAPPAFWMAVALGVMGALAQIRSGRAARNEELSMLPAVNAIR